MTEGFDNCTSPHTQQIQTINTTNYNITIPLKTETPPLKI